MVNRFVYEIDEGHARGDIGIHENTGTGGQCLLDHDSVLEVESVPVTVAEENLSLLILQFLTMDVICTFIQAKIKKQGDASKCNRGQFVPTVVCIRV